MTTRRPPRGSSDEARDLHERPTKRPAQLQAPEAEEPSGDLRPSTGPRVRRSILIRMSELFADARFEEALALAQSIPKTSDDHVIVDTCERECRRRLQDRYFAHIGRLDARPRVLVSGSAVKALALDHRAAFVLAQVDGATTYESLLDLSGMPPFETLRILDRLLALGAIGA